MPAAATAGNANGTTQQTPHATAPAAVVKAATDAVRSGPVAQKMILLDSAITLSLAAAVIVADSSRQELLKERVGHLARAFRCRNREVHALVDFR